MNIGWRKAWRDLIQSKTRTLLVVLSVFAGLFALGMVFGLSNVMRSRMSQDHLATMPAHINFGGGPFTEEVIKAVESERDVAKAERWSRTTFRWKLEGETEWRPGNLVAREDYPNQQMDYVELWDGAWPTKGFLAIERQSSRYFGIPVGASILVEYGKRERPMTTVGILRDPTVTSPQFGESATFYALPETAAWLTGLEDSNTLGVRLTAFDQTEAEQTAKRLQNRLERMGIKIAGYIVNDPNTHPLQSLVDAMTVILSVLGALCLVLSTFLIINTMRAIVLQQVWQIGVMKVYGATTSRLVRIYLTIALLYGIFAILSAVPLAALATHWISNWLLDLMNIAGAKFRVMRTPITVQCLIGLVLPMLASLGPVLTGASITPRQAISSYGLAEQFEHGWLDRVIQHLRNLPRPLAVSLRNSFRRKLRVVLTLLTLAVSGIMFITVMSVKESLGNTLEILIRDLGLDVWAVFSEPQRSEALIEIAQAVSGTKHAEVWDQRAARLKLASGEESEIYLMGVPSDSVLFTPRLVSGRGFIDTDDYAILLNNKIASDEGLKVGDQVEITLNRRTSKWTIVGLVLSVTNQQRDSFVPLPALARETGSVNRGTVVMLQSSRSDEQQFMRDLRDAYGAERIKPAFLLSANEIRQQTQAQFDIILILLLVMAVLAAIVGSFGLMGNMSISVIERTKEIAVMRAIGASSSAIVGIFVSEGLLLGLLSWIIAVPLSYPGSRLFSDLVGAALFDVPLDFSYSVSGLIMWFVIVVVLSAFASLWPAMRAASLHVVEALRFE